MGKMKKMKVLLMLTLLSGFYVLPIVAHTKEEVADPKETIESKVEDQASEYFKAILNEDYKTVVKYVHPNVVNDLGDKDAVIELLKLGVDALKEEGMEVVSVSITGIEIGMPEPFLKR